MKVNTVNVAVITATQITFIVIFEHFLYIDRVNVNSSRLRPGVLLATIQD